MDAGPDWVAVRADAAAAEAAELQELLDALIPATAEEPEPAGEHKPAGQPKASEQDGAAKQEGGSEQPEAAGAPEPAAGAAAPPDAATAAPTPAAGKLTLLSGLTMAEACKRAGACPQAGRLLAAALPGDDSLRHLGRRSFLALAGLPKALQVQVLPPAQISCRVYNYWPLAAAWAAAWDSAGLCGDPG